MSAPTASPSLEESLYSPLAISDEIRLLYLQPRAFAETVTCTLKHVKLSDEPKYEALSYEWGAKDTHQISFNGRVRHVRLNLHNALLNLRQETEERVMWIDALCINQNDMQERNHQVTQMGRIYENATCMVVWLGLVDEDCAKALEVLQSKEKFPARKDFSLGRAPIFPPFWKRDKALEEDRLLTLKSFRVLAQRSYWSRLWIAQEILLASKLYVQVGKHSILWERLLEFVFSKQAKGNKTTRAIAEELKNSKMTSFCREWPRRQIYRSDEDLYSLCIGFGGAECENVLDRVFELCGLTAECCRNAAPIDYGLTIDEVLEKLAAHVLCTHYQGQPKYVDVETLNLIVKNGWKAYSLF